MRLRYIPETMPTSNHSPKNLKTFATAIAAMLKASDLCRAKALEAFASAPENNAWFPMIYYRPNPYAERYPLGNFVAFVANKRL